MNRTTYKIVVSGLLIAISVVLTRVFSANFMIAGVPAARLSIGFLPIILSGVILGPGWGFAVGALADVLGFLVFPSGTYFPPITLTSALAGLLPALIARYSGNMALWLKSLVSVTTVQVICSMLLQTCWIALLYGKAFNVFFLPRAIVALVTIPVYFVFVHSILTSLKHAKLLPPQPAGKAKE